MRTERLRLVDDQAREAASALIDSDLNSTRIVNFARAEKIIAEELGESRFGKFFVIRNGKGEIIFESSEVKDLVPSEIPRENQWYTIETADKLVRILNLKLPRVQDRSLQVGIVIDRNLVEPNYFSWASVVFVLTVVSLGLLASFIASSFLMRPISSLETFLSGTLSQPSSELPNLPTKFMESAGLKTKDEFSRLLFGLNEMINKVNRNYRSSRLWGYQMAHELKTPLTLIMLEAEKGQRIERPEKQLNAIQREANKINDTIQSFLGWAELENSGVQKNLFAIRLQKIVEQQVERMKYAHGERIQIIGQSQCTVVCNPQHLEQLISNLVTNGLRYSPEDKMVAIELSEDKLTVKDQGPGFPTTVLERLGEPFNKGGGRRSEFNSHGLGLAWVNSIVRNYGWLLDVQSTSSGSAVTIFFQRA